MKSIIKKFLPVIGYILSRSIGSLWQPLYNRFTGTTFGKLYDTFWNDWHDHLATEVKSHFPGPVVITR